MAGDVVTEYADAPSIAAHESRLEIIQDTSLGNTEASDQRGEKAVADGRNPKNKDTLVINSQYDLESIQVGETCILLNADLSASLVTNAQIVGLSYENSRVTLELEESSFDLGLALQRFKDA
ncbi:MAG: hypothetical protein QM775_25635 [Pirellulales bacterium]